jgi:uncharacterized membrane protein YheB (UPF0754 family)
MTQEQPGNKREKEQAFQSAKNKSREHFRRLGQLIIKYSRWDRLSTSPTPPKSSPSPVPSYSNTLLKTLALFPWFLLGAFSLSFVWDFNELSSVIGGFLLEFEGILRIVSVSGLIGFFTNWLAITMLFKPAKKRPILGHGLIPAQKERIAYRLAQAVSEDLINPEIIKAKIKESDIIRKYRRVSTRYLKSIIDDPAFRIDLKQWVVTYLDEMIADPEIRTAIAAHILNQIEEAIQNKSLEKVAFKAYSYIKGQEMQQMIEEALTQIPLSVENGLDKVDHILDTLPKKIDDNSIQIENIVTTLLYRLINQLNVHSLVEENLRSYDEQKISDVIQNASNEQLRYIQYLGAVLGFIGGLVIWEPIISLSVLTVLFIGILGVDYLLLRFS